MADDRRVADYFVVVGTENLQNPEGDAETLEPITDLAVIFKSKGETPPAGFECIDLTPTGLAADLNAGSIRSDSCFLCYKRGRDKAPLVDIGVLYEGKQRLMPSCGIINKTPTNLVANVNNSTNMRIFITYRRASPQFAHSQLAVIDICVIIASKGEKPPHAFCLIEKDLNQGLVGSDVYLCYRKSLARTNSVSYKAEIISRYPLVDHSEFPLPDSVPLFCLPIGAVVECWAATARPPLPIFSTFALTGYKGEKIYAAGITFFEELPEESYSDEVNEMLKEQQQNRKGEKYLVHTNKCICVLSHYPFFDAFRKFLLAIYRLSISGSQTIPLERYVSHFMTSVPFPTPQKPRVQVQMTHESFDIQEPSHGPLPISGASHSSLLRSLGPDNVLTLFYCALSEHKILIHSLRPALLTSVGEALTSLLFPFIWQCPYIPLCPLKLADMLSAPCPFIYGIDSRFFDRGSPPEDVTCVDLDTNMITQAMLDLKEPREVSWRLLPKKPGKILKDRLDVIFSELVEVYNEDVDRAIDMPPMDADGSLAKRKEKLEIGIQEAFLRFNATILKGYRNFLLPITTKPTMESCDISKIFDLQGFQRSRPREYQRFFSILMKTQLFSHFVQQRFFASTNDALLAFFDDCTEKCESNKPLLQISHAPNQNTVVVTPPDCAGLPIDAVYEYNGFPKLQKELFVQGEGSANLLKPSNLKTPPRSPAVGRTKHERDQCTVSAKKQSNSPTLWAKCLLGHCFAIWFIHLPAYIKTHHNKKKVLDQALEVLQRIAEQRAQLPDEVCFRVLMQLAGQFGHPALAVKVLFEMRRQKIAPNAITWGYYHRAVIEGKWSSDHSSAKELWRKLRHILVAIAVFKKGRKMPDLISFHGSSENLAKVGVQETASEGTASDAGYSSLLSTEDLTRSQPIAGGLSEFPAEFPEMPSKAEVHHTVFSKCHRRAHSASDMSEAESEPGSADSDLLGSSSAYPWFQRKPLARHLSETSIGSNLSDSPGSNQIIISHSGSWQEPYHMPAGSLDSFDDSEFRYPFRQQSDIAFEAVMGTSQSCKNCRRIMYDEEIMGGWSADDSNWNTLCPFCQEKQVPLLQVKIKDYRGLQSKVCSTSSLNSEPTSVSHSLSNAIEIGGTEDAGETSSLLGESVPLSPPSMNLSQMIAGSKPMPIISKRFNRDLMLSSSAPTSASSSPLPGHRNSPRQQFYRVRKSSSSSSLTVFVAGAPEEKPTECVPYLSPLVLRKELETLLVNDGDLPLQESDIVVKKPILFWNLVWYFKRLGLGSHLTDLILQSYKNTEKATEEQNRTGSRVIISTSWDNERLGDANHISLYMLWSVPESQQDAYSDNRLASRSLLKSVTAHIQENDVQSPMNILLDERSRQQKIEQKIHWSLYRELMFLSVTACGVDAIDIEAFDREYKNAYKQLYRERADQLKIDDKPPTGKAFWCRRAFQQPTLQPRLPNIALLP